MHLVVITANISRFGGGPFESVRRLSQTLSRAEGVDVTVLGLSRGAEREDIEAWAPLDLVACPVLAFPTFKFAPALDAALSRAAPDIVHRHGLWSYPSVATRKWHGATGKPYVISPRGMLDDWAIKNSRWKKQIARLLYERRHLSSAACLHALSEAEYAAIRRRGLRNPVCVVPNAVDMPGDSPGIPAPWATTGQTRKRVLLFLGRVHPKKGVIELLEAWQRLQRHHARARDWQLAVVGWEDGSHGIRSLAAAREPSVSWLGPVFGAEKHACFTAADAFILPSFSEGVPMAVLEAWSHGVPTLITRACNLPEGFEAGAAVEIAPDSDSIEAELKRLFEMPPERLAAIGAAARELARSRFGWPAIAERMLAVYRWLLEGGQVPPDVRIG